jgi:hypothetical protein
MRKLAFGAFALLLLAVSGAAAETRSISLAPVPFEVRMPAEIADRLTTAPMSGPFAEEAVKAGVTASTLVNYETADGQKTILMGVYYTPEDRFDAAQNPSEPPPFGQPVIRAGGMVLSIAGPHDTIFDPETVDGKNVVAASALIYEPGSYTRAE